MSRRAIGTFLDAVREGLGEDVFALQFWPFGKDGLVERTTLMFNIPNDAIPLPGLASAAVRRAAHRAQSSLP